MASNQHGVFRVPARTFTPPKLNKRSLHIKINKNSVNFRGKYSQKSLKKRKKEKFYIDNPRVES